MNMGGNFAGGQTRPPPPCDLGQSSAVTPNCTSLPELCVSYVGCYAVHFFKNTALRVTQKRVHASAHARALLVCMKELKKVPGDPGATTHPLFCYS
jgi:hypothetical protein